MSEFCVNWVSYQKSISKGFSRLQQDGEFVDMTLAAEGHLVQVHKNIVALASPYLKAMIQSAPCQHPVVFLNKISYEILGFILEYIYTGEVKISSDVLPVFIEACKGLHLNGVNNLDLPMTTVPETCAENLEQVKRIIEPPDKSFAAHITINSENYNIEVVPMDNTIELDNNIPILDNYITNTDFPKQIPDYPITISNIIKDIIVDKQETKKKEDQLINESINNVEIDTHKKVRTILPHTGESDNSQHYSISNRGSLQLMLNRYMYYCHHHSCEGRRRRWRCIDYRKMQCPAIIDTYDDNIVNRSEMHCHSYHDTKILRKFKSKSVFTSLVQAEERMAPRKKARTKLNRKK